MASFPCEGTSCQRARAGTPGLWQKRITSVVTSRQDGNELTLIMVFVWIIRTFFAAVSVHLCVIENFTRPRPRTWLSRPRPRPRTWATRPRPGPRTWKCVLKDPRGQGHVLEDSITGVQNASDAINIIQCTGGIWAWLQLLIFSRLCSVLVMPRSCDNDCCYWS